MTTTTTTVRAIRNGEPCQLVQKRSPTGIPCCVQCLKPIPLANRRWDEQFNARSLFCTDTHAVAWAMWAAGQIYPPPPTTKEEDHGTTED